VNLLGVNVSSGNLLTTQTTSSIPESRTGFADTNRWLTQNHISGSVSMQGNRVLAVFSLSENDYIETGDLFAVGVMIFGS
jgi:hypothetical protein